MINNDVSNHLSRYFTNRANPAEAGGVAANVYKRLKAKHDSIVGKNTPAEEEAAAADKATNEHVGNGVLRTKKKAADNEAAKEKEQAKAKAKDAEAELSPEERRQKELKAILDKLNAEEAAGYPSRVKKDQAKESEEVKSEIISPEKAEEKSGSGGFMSFLNDMPLFNEFKIGLMDAFKRLDSASAGSISAQYELNYTSMQYVANAAGGFDYKETTLNIKLDLNYVKAAAGGQSGKQIADMIGSSDDFESLVNNLNSLNQPQQTQNGKGIDPNDMMASLKDYFSPEKTAGRIVDFATAFFPMSDAFKAKGDTEEARNEFAEMMRNAIQKGFDQAMGVLGAVPKSVQEGIDKTHELTFKGIDDFVKNGLNKNKEQNGIYSALEQFAFSAQVNYSETSYSYRPGSSYNRDGAAQNNPQTQQTLDTQA